MFDPSTHLAAEVLAPGHFYLAPGKQLRLDHAPQETIVWELFHGRLLDVKQAREKATFESWNLFLEEEGTWSEEPLLSLKYDAARQQLHVVRAVRSYVWEGYDSGGGVYLSREAIRWVRELVETVDLKRWTDKAALRGELTAAITHAVVGSSRLPLTSIEAPMPAYALGHLFYCYQPNPPREPYRDSLTLLAAVRDLQLHPGQWARLLQLLIQTAPADELAHALRGLPLMPLLRRMVNEVSLSPWTELVPRTLAFLDAVVGQDSDPVVRNDRIGILSHDKAAFVADWLIQLGRHLTAYDLITFHHRGANYPDALALDLLLKRLLRSPGEFSKRERRALRQAWFLRRFYEGHPVPEVPTSPGENLRVYPGQARVPDEQFQHFAKRPRRLYENDPLAVPAGLQQSFDDLDDPRELRELGLALFVDRPLGAGKRPGEPDQTIMLAHLAFSRSLARQRLRFLYQPMNLLSAERHEYLQQRLTELNVPGVPLDQLGGSSRPGTVSIQDARQVSDDFVFLHTMPGALCELGEQYDLSPLALGGGRYLVVPVSPPNQPSILRIYDAEQRVVAEMRARSEGGFIRAGGVEYLAEGFDLMGPGSRSNSRITRRSLSFIPPVCSSSEHSS